MRWALPCVLSLAAGLPGINFVQQVRFASEEAALELQPDRQPWHPAGLVAVLGEERGRKWDLAGRGLAVRPDGKQIAVGGFGGAIYLMDAETLRVVRILRGDASFVASVHYSPSANALLSVGSDMAIRSWALDGDDPVQPVSLAALGNFPSSAAWSADGSTLVVRDQGLHVWRRTGGAKMMKVTTVAEHKPRRGVPEEIRQVAETVGTGRITFWNEPVVAVSADGTRIAATSGGGVAGIQLDPENSMTATASSAVTVWRVEEESVEKQWTIDGLAYVGALAFSPDGRSLAVGTHDHKVHLFDIAGELPQSRRVVPHNAPVKALCYDVRGETLAVAADSVQLWDVLQEPPALRGEGLLAYGSIAESNQMAFSPDGSALYYVDGCVVRRWPTSEAAPERLGNEKSRFHEVHSLDITPDGRQLIAAIRDGKDGGIATWKLASLAAGPAAQPLLPGFAGDDVTISPDGRMFAISVYKHPHYRLQLWQIDEGGMDKLAEADLAAGHPGSFWCAAFTPDGSRLVTGHRDGRIRTWDVRDGQLTPIGEPAQADSGGVGGLAFAPDGERLATVDWAGEVILWTREADGFRRHELGKHGSRAYAVAFSLDGRFLASGDYSGGIKLWDLAAEESAAVELEAHSLNITSLAFAPDGGTLLSAGGDGRVMVWDLGFAKPRHEWRFPGGVYAAVYHPSGEYIVSGNANGTIYVWRP